MTSSAATPLLPVVRRAAALLLAVSLLALPLGAASHSAATGRGGAVASGETAATSVGLEILRRGGNATDAAVATALALAVVHPEAGNLGGGGFALVRFGDEIAALDFRETAPAAAHHDLYLDEAGEPIPGASLLGPLAAGVPGSPAGLHELHRRFGRLPWAEVVAPAAHLAAEGFVVTGRLARALDEERGELATFAETARVWLPDGAPLAAGTRLQLAPLAATLRRYAAEGPAALAVGDVADAIAEAARRGGGILTAEDLASYRPVWREPLRFTAFGWEMAAMPLPTSGGVLVAQALAMLEASAWQSKPRFGAERAHLLAEVWRRGFADRSILGDPASTDARPEQLLDPGWIHQRLASIAGDRATPSVEIGPYLAEPIAEAAETTHLSTIDRDGNLVALTTTLNGLFGCKLWVPELGFLNNEMDDFATAPGRPNVYGLVQDEANAVAPGHRMLSSMSPTIAWQGSRAIALGGRGGSRIPTATLQVLLAFAVDGDELQAAVDRPRLHHQWLPDRLYTEPDALSPETGRALQARGHQLAVADDGLARVNAVAALGDGRVAAAGDPRGPGDGGVVEPEP